MSDFNQELSGTESINIKRQETIHIEDRKNESAFQNVFQTGKFDNMHMQNGELTGQKSGIIEKNENKQDQEHLNEVLISIKGNMPPDFKNATVEDILKAIEDKMAAVTSDRRRAARFDKVRKAVDLYNMVSDTEDKQMALLGIREAAANYLMERKKGSYADRKTLCEDLIRSIDSYTNIAGKEKEHNPEYLLGDRNVPDELVEAEITIAYKHACEDKSSSVSDMKDRKEAYKRKIVHVRHAHNICSSMQKDMDKVSEVMNRANEKYELKKNEDVEGYDMACDRIVMAYSSLKGYKEGDTVRLFRLLSATKNDDKRILRAKENMLAKIIVEVLEWNIKDFEFDTPEKFLCMNQDGKYMEGTFKDKYYKLQIASLAGYLIQELDNLNSDYFVGGMMRSAIRAKLGAFWEIAQEYEERLELMSNPYYALLLEKDTSRFNKGGDITSLTEDRDIPGVQSKFSASKTFKDYVTVLSDKKNRINNPEDAVDTHGNSIGKQMIFKRKTDVNKLLAWHNKQSGVVIPLREEDIQKEKVSVNVSMIKDKGILDELLGE